MIEKGAAAILALSGFALAIVLGLAVGNPISTVLWRAVVALLCCYAAGLVIGMIAGRIMREHVDQYKYYNPVRPEDTPVGPIEEEKEDEENAENTDEEQKDNVESDATVDAAQPAV